MSEAIVKVMRNKERMLVLDYALSPAVINEGIAGAFGRAGMAVDTRPFYPNLVRDDLERYGTIGLLSGRTPAFPSGRMSAAEVEEAAKLVSVGGTLILGPNLEGGEGAHERYQFNRLLANLDVQIRIDDELIEDSVNGYAAPLWDRPFYRPIPGSPVQGNGAERLAFDRSTPLRVGEDASVLLATFETARPKGEMAVVAMARSGKGHVLVAGRYLLNATGVPLRISGEPLAHPEWLEDTSAFLDDLARYVVGVTTGAMLLEAVNPIPESTEESGEPIDLDLDESAVADSLPPRVRTEIYPVRDRDLDWYDRRTAEYYEEIPDERHYGWIRREGIRASWGSTVQWGGNQTTKVEVEQVCKALEACDVNLFWDISNCQAVAGAGFSEAERAAVLERWEWTAAALDGSSVKWYPTLDYRFFRDERTRCFGAQGQELEAPSPMDLEFWRRGWRAPLCAIADFSLSHPCVGGIAIDVELYAHPPAFNYYMGYGFEDACYTFVLDRWEGWIDGAVLAEAEGLRLRERFDWLRTRGLLEGYFTVLSSEVERICREIRDDVWRINPDLLFASYIFTTPCNWFDLGVYRGFSSPDRPVVLMTFNVRSGRMREYLRENRIHAYHASSALLGMIEREAYAPVFAKAHEYGHGYWMNNINALLYAGSDSCESPARQGLTPEEAIEAIRDANEQVRNET